MQNHSFWYSESARSKSITYLIAILYADDHPGVNECRPIDDLSRWSCTCKTMVLIYIYIYIKLCIAWTGSVCWYGCSNGLCVTDQQNTMDIYIKGISIRVNNTLGSRVTFALIRPTHINASVVHCCCNTMYIIYLNAECSTILPINQT